MKFLSNSNYMFIWCILAFVVLIAGELKLMLCVGITLYTKYNIDAHSSIYVSNFTGTYILC
jgi:hypothetical protein